MHTCGSVGRCNNYMYNREVEFLGSGEFGTVYRGVWSHSEMGRDQIVQEEVAVKTMEDEASKEDRIKFLQEAAIMGQFDHPNIVKVMGIMVNKNEVSYCEFRL